MAKMKVSYPKQEDIPEALRPFYSQVGEEWILVTDKDGDKELKRKLKEFRDNNIDLKKQLEKYKDVDPEKYEELLKIKQQQDNDEEGKKIKAGKIDEVVTQRTEVMRKDYEKKLQEKDTRIKALEEASGSLRTGFEDLLLEKNLLGAINKVAKIREGAMDDVLGRAKRIWKMNDDRELIAHDGKGEPLMGKKGNEAMTMPEYVADLVQTAPFLFEGASGAGSRGGKQSGGGQSGVKIVDGNDPVESGKHMKDLASGAAVAKFTD